MGSGPEADRGPAAELTPGVFYGHVSRQRRSELVTLSVVTHAEARRVPEHSHAHAFLMVLLRGGYHEDVDAQRIVYGPLSVVFHPEGLVHQDEIGAGGAEFFTVEVAPGFARERGKSLEGLGSVRDLSGGEAAWKMLDLYRALREGEDSDLALEEPVAEVLEALGSGASDSAASDPPWLDGVVTILESRYREPLSLGGLAREAGVHPVHLARVHRQRRGRSLRDSLQRLRVVEACRLVQEGMPLAEAAAATGFVDQSHMTHVFRRVTGSTPGALRDLLGGPEGGTKR